jgi:hypothetical protein
MLVILAIERRRAGRPWFEASLGFISIIVVHGGMCLLSQLFRKCKYEDWGPDWPRHKHKALFEKYLKQNRLGCGEMLLVFSGPKSWVVLNLLPHLVQTMLEE